MALPSWNAQGASTFFTAACGVWTDSNGQFPATVNSGDILIIMIRATSTVSVNTIDTVAGFTVLSTVGVGGLVASSFQYKVAAGTEGGQFYTVSGTCGGTGIGERMGAIAHRFVGATGGVHLVGGNATGSSTTPNFASVVTTNPGELAVGLLSASVSTTVTNSTGETGGDWTEPVAETNLTGITFDVQTAGMNAAGTITGGTMTLGTTGTWWTSTLALIGTPDPAAKLIGRSQAIKRASYR